MKHDGRVSNSEIVVFDVNLVSGGQLRVIQNLILSSAQVSDAVFHLQFRFS